MKKNKKNRKQKKPRNMVVLNMILHTKSEKFHYKCEERGGSKNRNKEYQERAEE